MRHFLEGDFTPVKVKKSTDTGERPRVKNTVFVSKESADAVKVKRGQVVKEWKNSRGRTVKRTIQPLAPKPEKFKDAAERFKRAKKKKGTRRYMMVRRTNASGQTGGLEFEDYETLVQYQQIFRKRFLDKEIDRLRSRHGMTLAAARKQARANANEVIESWYVAEYEEEE